MATPRAWVAVACSGGRDSTALLQATIAACAPLGIGVVALHVHHGLQPDADRWLAHCREDCAGRAAAGQPVRFAATRIAGRPPRGASVEAWAREARYRALADMARQHGVDLVLLAQHRRDQAETLLLQALRGAGVAGLAGMPARIERDGIVWARPWLAMPRETIEAYARRERLAWVEDGSNADPRYARSRLRRQVWPALTSAFADAEAALAASAGWAAQAARALDELAALDLCAVGEGGALLLPPWLALSPARRVNVLRAWLRGRLGGPAPSSLTQRLAAELPGARSARWPAPGGELRCHRGRLQFVAREARRETPAEPFVATLAIRRGGTYRVPRWRGRLRVSRVAHGGVPLAWLEQLELRPRSGGERFQAGPGRPPRSLKKQFQAAAVPAWARTAPIVHANGQLVFVPGLGIDARALAPPGEPQVQIEWLPDAAAGSRGD